MIKTFSLLANCKINIYLRILGKRSDGYHDLDSLFYPLSHPADHLDIAVHSGSGMTLRCCPRSLEKDGNILHITYEAFAEMTGFRPGLKVFLRKGIPVGAGLGGGSSDAAAFLLFLNSMTRTKKLSQHKLLVLAAKIGADVPFFIFNRPARIGGTGDKITAVNVNLKNLYILVVCPDIPISTAWAYQAWDEYGLYRKNTVPAFLTTEAKKDKGSTFDRLVLSNCFEQVVFPAFPQLGLLKLELMQKGAAGCVLSGSGSSLSAFFRDKDTAMQACFTLDRQNIPFYYNKM